MNLEQLGKKARPIWKKHGRKIAAITVGLVVAIGLYNYYDNHVIKQSPEYMIEQLNTAIQMVIEIPYINMSICIT